MKFGPHAWVSRQSETIAFGLLLAVVMLAPLPFGSNGSESMVALAGLSGIVLVLTSLAIVLEPQRFQAIPAPRLTCALIAFFVFGAWAVIQVIPGLPGFLPHPLWAERERILGVAQLSATISIDPELTWASLCKSGGYFAIGIASAYLLRGAGRRRLAYTLLAIAGGVYAAYGLIELASGDCCVVWQKKIAYNGVATGPFINRNSFATYLGLIALVGLGYVLRELGDLRRVSAPTFTRRLAAQLRLLLAHRWLMIAVMLTAITALLFTVSRAGTSSFLLGASVLVLLLSQTRLLGERRRRTFHFIIFAVVAGLSLAVFGRDVLSRVSNEGVEDTYRTQSWKIMITGIEASPWLGHGFGTFPEVFPLYRDDRLPSRRYWDKAQNTYLELALDMGIPATTILLLGFGALAAQCVKGLARQRRDRRLYPSIGLAAMALIGVHSFLDFSMQIPAIATTFAFIMGIAITESGIWRSRDPDQSSAT